MLGKTISMRHKAKKKKKKKKKDFLENSIWHFMQIVSLADNLHEVSDPILQEKKRISSVLLFAEFSVDNPRRYCVSDVNPLRSSSFWFR